MTEPVSARRIRIQQGHYILRAKGNRVQVEADIRELFALPCAMVVSPPPWPYSSLAVLNSLILALFGHHNVTSVRTAIRTLAAFPDQALALLTHPL